MSRETAIDVLLRETGFPTSPTLDEATELLKESGPSAKGLRSLLRRRAGEQGRPSRMPMYRVRPPLRLEIRPGGYIVDAAAEEIEARRWQAHLRSLEAQHEAARLEREPEAQAQREYDEARREQARRETPPGFPPP